MVVSLTTDMKDHIRTLTKSSFDIREVYILPKNILNEWYVFRCLFYLEIHKTDGWVLRFYSFEDLAVEFLDMLIKISIKMKKLLKLIM